METAQPLGGRVYPLVVRYDERYLQNAAQTQQVLWVFRTKDFAEEPEADRRVGYGAALLLQRSVQGGKRAGHAASVGVIRLRDFFLPSLYQRDVKRKGRMAAHARDEEVVKTLAALAIDKKDPIVNADGADLALLDGGTLRRGNHHIQPFVRRKNPVPALLEGQMNGV